MNRSPVSRIGDAHEVTPTRIYVGASATPEHWSNVLTDALVSGRTVRVLVDEETVPTVQLMSDVTDLAALGGLTAWWSLASFPLSVDLRVAAMPAPAQSEGSHGSGLHPAGQVGEPAPINPRVGAGPISTNQPEGTYS